MDGFAGLQGGAVRGRSGKVDDEGSDSDAGVESEAIDPVITDVSLCKGLGWVWGREWLRRPVEVPALYFGLGARVVCIGVLEEGGAFQEKESAWEVSTISDS
eukprot:scaffold83910_cov15-Tisochrysis_lutea.AAC.1